MGLKLHRVLEGLFCIAVAFCYFSCNWSKQKPLKLSVWATIMSIFVFISRYIHGLIY